MHLSTPTMYLHPKLIPWLEKESFPVTIELSELPGEVVGIAQQ